MDAISRDIQIGPESRAASWLRWILPDLALVLAVTAVLCLFCVLGGSSLFGDTDAGWHIRVGEGILGGAGLPTKDPYSFSRAGAPWFAWEWGADLLMGGVHRLGGLDGVAMLYGLVLGSSVWLWARLNRGLGGHPLITVALSPLLFGMTWIHWHARPHLLSWLLLLATVYYIERNRPRLWIIAMGAAIWANTHASFLLAPAILLLYAAGRLLRPVVWAEDNRSADFRAAAWFGAAAGIALLATLANPYGWAVHLHVLAYLSDVELLSRISEFQAFDYFTPGAGLMILGLITVAIGGVLSFLQRTPERAFVCLLLFIMAVRSARGLPLAGLLCLPIANAALTRQLSVASGLAPWLRRRVARFLAYGENLVRIDKTCSGAVTAISVLAGLGIALHTGAIEKVNFPPRDLPVHVANRLGELPAGVRILAPDDYGGYLIYRFNGRIKVYFDGRSDFYGARFVREYLGIMGLRPGWRDKVTKWGFTHALLRKDAPIRAALEETGWQRLYADGVAVLLEAPKPPRLTGCLR